MKSLSKNPYLKIFLFGFLTAFCLFLPYLIVDKGFFIYAGDYNSQQIPFYMYANEMIHSGSANWSWATDLGSSFINSYSFYLLGSPFFWLSTLFPTAFIPYLMPFLLMLKFALASLGAFGYMRRYAKSDEYAYLGAMLYAFCGFGIYNIFFNHFLESFAFFPFLLWALDSFVYEKKRGIFVLAVAVNLLNNYFFFVGQVVFLLIYFICKIVTNEYKISIKEFAVLALESVNGCLMGIVLFIPAFINLMGNPRTLKTAEGFSNWMYYSVQQYFAIILSAVFPPDPPYIPNLFTDCTIKWTSMSAFIALGGLMGYFIFTRYKKHSSFTMIFSVSILFAMIPVLNSSFYGFNKSYYARWFYMPVLMLACMNMQSFSFSKKKIYFGLKCTAVLTAAFAVFGLTPHKDGDKLIIGLSQDAAVFWLNLIIAIFSLYIAFVVVLKLHNQKKYTQYLMACAVVIILLFGNVHLSMTKFPQWDNDLNFKKYNYDFSKEFILNDDAKNFRLDAYGCYDNLGLFINQPVIQSFNSVVTPSIMNFYPAVGVKRDVSSKPDYSDYALRSLLSVKYMIIPKDKLENIKKESNLNYYTLYQDFGPYSIYKNENFISMGFAYDSYVTESQLEDIPKSDRSKILLRAIVLEDEVVERYHLGINKLSDDAIYDYTNENFLQDLQNRRLSSCYNFERTDDGFISNMRTTQNEIIFYSVPYDKGFSAYVNGVPAEVLKVSYGMCAVVVPSGDNEIVFKYHTPGFKTGILLSCLGLVIYIGYIIILIRKGYFKWIF